MFRFGRVDEVRFKTGVVRGLFKTPKFFGAFVAQRDAERTDFMPIGLHVGLLQVAEDGDRVHRELDALGGDAHLAAQPRALGRGHLANIVRAFDQQNVGLACLRERVSHAAADRAAADDDDFATWELIHSYCCGSRRKEARFSKSEI